MTIPPNTTAVVTLPGQAGDGPVEIGSGRYRWTVPFQVEDNRLAAFSLDMTIGELIDYPGAYPQVMSVFRGYNAELASRLEKHTTMTLHQAAALMPNPEVIQAQVEKTLERLRE